MYFGVGRSGKGYSFSLSLSLSLSQHTHTHTHSGEKGECVLTIVVRNCVEIFFYENKDGGSVNAS